MRVGLRVVCELVWELVGGGLKVSVRVVGEWLESGWRAVGNVVQTLQVNLLIDFPPIIPTFCDYLAFQREWFHLRS